MGWIRRAASELIAATHTLEEIQRYLNADSLAYLSLEGLTGSVKPSQKSLLHVLLHRALSGGVPAGHRVVSPARLEARQVGEVREVRTRPEGSRRKVRRSSRQGPLGRAVTHSASWGELSGMIATSRRAACAAVVTTSLTLTAVHAAQRVAGPPPDAPPPAAQRLPHPPGAPQASPRPRPTPQSADGRDRQARDARISRPHAGVAHRAARAGGAGRAGA